MSEPINAGDGFELVADDSFFGHDARGRVHEIEYEFTTDGVTWKPYNTWHIMSMPVGPKWAREHQPELLAFRRRSTPPPPSQT